MIATLAAMFLLCASVHDAAEHAETLSSQGHYLEAQSILEAALADAERTGSRELATVLNNLGTVYWKLGRPRDAERSYERSLAIHHALGETDTRDVARILNNLGLVQLDLKNLSKSEATLLRAVALHRSLGENDPGLVRVLGNLGLTYQAERRWAEAEDNFRQALTLATAQAGSSRLQEATALNNLGVLFNELHRLREAEAAFTGAVEIWRVELGPRHPLLASGLNNIGVVFVESGRLQQAEPYLAGAVEMAAAMLPENHPNLARYRMSYASLLRKLNRKKEARGLEKSAQFAVVKHAQDNALGYTIDIQQFRK